MKAAAYCRNSHHHIVGRPLSLVMTRHDDGFLAGRQDDEAAHDDRCHGATGTNMPRRASRMQYHAGEMARSGRSRHSLMPLLGRPLFERPPSRIYRDGRAASTVAPSLSSTAIAPTILGRAANRARGSAHVGVTLICMPKSRRRNYAGVSRVDGHGAPPGLPGCARRRLSI